MCYSSLNECTCYTIFLYVILSSLCVFSLQIKLCAPQKKSHMTHVQFTCKSLLYLWHIIFKCITKCGSISHLCFCFSNIMCRNSNVYIYANVWQQQKILYYFYFKHYFLLKFTSLFYTQKINYLYL